MCTEINLKNANQIKLPLVERTALCALGSTKSKYYERCVELNPLYKKKQTVANTVATVTFFLKQFKVRHGARVPRTAINNKLYISWYFWPTLCGVFLPSLPCIVSTLIEIMLTDKETGTQYIQVRWSTGTHHFGQLTVCGIGELANAIYYNIKPARYTWYMWIIN